MNSLRVAISDLFKIMSIGNQTYRLQNIMCLDSVYFDWRFLTSPPDGGYVRNDISFLFKRWKSWRFAERIANSSRLPLNTLSFRALARNPTFSCFYLLLIPDTHIILIIVLNFLPPSAFRLPSSDYNTSSTH